MSKTNLIFDVNELRAELQRFYEKKEFGKGVEFLTGILVGVEQINPPYGVYEADEDQQEDMAILSEEGRVWTQQKKASMAILYYEQGRLYQAAGDHENSALAYSTAKELWDTPRVYGENVYERVLTQLRLDQVTGALQS